MSECPVIISSKTSSGVIPNIDEAISVPKIHLHQGWVKWSWVKGRIRWVKWSSVGYGVAVGAFSRE